MMGVKTDPATEGAVKAALAAGRSLREAAMDCGVTTSVVQRVAKEIGRSAMPGVEIDFRSEGDTATVTAKTREMVCSEEDALRVCKVDTSRWRVVSMQIKTYQVAMKLETKEEGVSGNRKVLSVRPHVEQLYGITLKLALIAPRPYLDATDALCARIGEKAPTYSPPPAAASAGRYVALLGLFDAHFAKLCWGEETGSDYDLKIAESVYRNAAEDLLRLLTPYPVGRFVLPLGNDFFHIDSLKNTTTGGTVVDCDSRYAKMIEIGELAVIRLIERLQELAPVDVFHVPGNHDRLSSYHLCRTIAAWFRNAPGVTVDLRPSIRKYRRYGANLFGFRHGDLLTDNQIPTLPGLMAVESPREWAETTCREWFLGHRHSSRRFVSRESDELHGVQIRYLSSLSGTDFWHHENGFVGNRRAAEAYLYTLSGGYTGHFVAPARES